MNFKFQFGVAVLIYCVFICSPLSAAEGTGAWSVGVARIDITPTDSLWLAGYASRDHGADSAMHSLWIKALVLRDGADETGVILTSDLLGFPQRLSNDIRDALQSTYGFDRRQIILSSSHTHSGPVLQDALYDIYPLDDAQKQNIADYSEQLKYDIIRVVGLALGDMQPARLTADNGVVRFQVNRRNNKASTLKAQTALKGPNDFAVPVLQIRHPDGSLRAVLFGYACHATVLNGDEWSGDYPGFAQIEIERNFPGVTALFFQGCGADLNPLPRRTIGLARQYGRELAAAVENVVDSGGEVVPADLQMAYEEVDLAFADPPSLESLQRLGVSGNDYQKRWAVRMLRAIENGDLLASSWPYPVQVWNLGGQALFALGGEVVVDYVIQLKRLFGQDVFVMAYANDVMGYIPSTRVLREGGYEGLTSQIVYGLPAAWEADIEARIISTALRMAEVAGIKMPQEQLVGE